MVSIAVWEVRRMRALNVKFDCDDRRKVRSASTEQYEGSSRRSGCALPEYMPFAYVYKRLTSESLSGLLLLEFSYTRGIAAMLTNQHFSNY